MAITNTLSRVDPPYAGNNSTVTPYSVPFVFLLNADVVIVTRSNLGVEVTLVDVTDYTLTGAGTNPPTGSFTTAVAVPVTSEVVVYRRTTATQTASYVETDEFPASSHERALDKATMLVQERADVDGRTFRLTNRSDGISEVTPKLDSVLGLDPAGVPWMKTASEVLTWINLVQTLGNFPTKTWLNAAERATAVPDFVGQVGVQRDTLTVYMGTALSAGSWSVVTAGAPGAASITTAMLQDGVLSADAAGRLKMAAAFLMASHANTDLVNGLTTKALLADADKLMGWSSADAALRSFAGNVVVPPGSVIQTKVGSYAANANLTTVLPTDDTVPQITEGTEIIAIPITPRFSDSTFLCSFSGEGTTAAANIFAAALFRDAISSALSASYTRHTAANTEACVSFSFLDAPATASEVTYRLRVGPGGAGTLRLNGTSAARVFGGASAATLTVQEIKV